MSSFVDWSLYMFFSQFGRFLMPRDNFLHIQITVVRHYHVASFARFLAYRLHLVRSYVKITNEILKGLIMIFCTPCCLAWMYPNRLCPFMESSRIQNLHYAILCTSPKHHVRSAGPPRTFENFLPAVGNQSDT